MAESTAIGGILDTDQIRIQLLASGQTVHAPLQDLVDVAAGVPIYASVAAASGSRIKARVKSIRVEFYAPSYSTLNTLVGSGYWSRMSLADITAAAYPALAQFRSVDRFMPDGTTDATNGGYWVLNDDEPTPQMLGLINDSAVLDQTAIFQAWVTLCGILGKPCIAPVPAWIKLTDTVTFPVQTDIDIEQIRITYSGLKDRKVLYVPAANTKTLTFGIVEGNATDWTSDDYVGIYLQDVSGCDITLKLTRRFTVGYGLFGVASTGTGYNRVWPGNLRDNKYSERLKALTAGGFVNQNTFTDGNYGNTSSSNLLGVSYGTHVTAAPGAYTGQNNNVWENPNYEMGGSAGVDRIPMFFDGAGGYNLVRGASRSESNFGPFALFSGIVQFNDIELNFASTAISGQLNTIQEVNGANSNRLRARYGIEVRRTFDNLHRLLSSNGGANGPYVRGDVFIMDSTSGLARRSTTLAGRVRSNALGLELANTAAVMVAVDTSKIKQWGLNVGYVGSGLGNLVAIAFDANGNRLTGNATSIYGTTWAATIAYALGDIVENDTGKIYRCAVAGTSAGAGGPTGTGAGIVDGTCTWNFFGTDRYIKTSSGGFAATANFGGGYLQSGFAGGQISVRPEVQTMWVGVAGTSAGAGVRSFEVVGYTTQETLDNTNGLTSLVPFVPLDDDGSERLASANPGTAGTHGYYSRGQTVYNSGAGSAVPSGWQCTTAGWLAAAWTISTEYSVLGRIVINGGNAYKLVTAGTSAGAGGPTGTTAGIVDGTCVWDFAGLQAVFTATTPAAPQTVASLPSAATAGSGARLFVSDATTPAWGAAVVGGGAVPCPVFSDGTTWNVG